MKKKLILTLFAAAGIFSCELYDETAATVNFWDFKNAVVKDWKENKDSFLPVDFSDAELTAALIEKYGTKSRFATLTEKNEGADRLLIGSPDDDYFGCLYFYKNYTEEAPLKSALGTWTGSLLYVTYSADNPVLGMISPDSGVDSIFCAFWAEAERRNKTTPGKIVVKIDMDCMTKIILDGYAYFYPQLKDGKEIQRVNGANLEGMYMTGFDVTFTKNAAAEGEEAQK